MKFKPYLRPFLLYVLLSIGIETLGLLREMYSYPLSVFHIGVVPFSITLYWSLIGLLSFLAYRKYGWKLGLFVGLIIDIPAEVIAYFSGVWRWNGLKPYLFTFYDAPALNFFVYITMSVYAILIYRYFVKGTKPRIKP